MEEVLQFIFELVFQAIFEVLGDVVWRRLPEPARVLIKLLLTSAFAVLLGFLSTLVLPEPFISARPLAIAYVVLGPLLLAWLMARVGAWMERKEKRRSTLERFGYGWLFAFSFTLTRFLITHRS